MSTIWRRRNCKCLKISMLAALSLKLVIERERESSVTFHYNVGAKLPLRIAVKALRERTKTSSLEAFGFPKLAKASWAKIPREEDGIDVSRKPTAASPRSPWPIWEHVV